MPIAFNTIDQIGGAMWRFGWVATTPPYRVYYEGRLLATITALEYILEDVDWTTEAPALEVLDATDTAAAENIAFPPRIKFQWRGTTGAHQYYVKHFENSAWVIKKRVLETGKGYYQFESEPIVDLTLDNWRIYAVSFTATESNPIEFSALVVRNPDPPLVTMTYDKVGSEIDITASS